MTLAQRARPLRRLLDVPEGSYVYLPYSNRVVYVEGVPTESSALVRYVSLTTSDAGEVRMKLGAPLHITAYVEIECLSDQSEALLRARTSA